MVETNERSNRANDKAWSDEEFIEFMGRIPSTARRLLAMLIQHAGDELETSVLCNDLGFSNAALVKMTFAGISRIARALGIAEDRVYVRAPSNTRAKQDQRYRIAPGLLRTARRHNWPSAHELKELI